MADVERVLAKQLARPRTLNVALFVDGIGLLEEADVFHR